MFYVARSVEKYLQQEKLAQEQAILEAEEESYEGMTEEEIKAAKERKKKFLELQRRYSAKEKEKTRPKMTICTAPFLKRTLNSQRRKLRHRLKKSSLKTYRLSRNGSVTAIE